MLKKDLNNYRLGILKYKKYKIARIVSELSGIL